ncbi:MAG: OmpA family protein [Alphaproteobacteria bacterium]|nr:OmpA family protein [Alphaproteobacteria bacterium]MBV8335429.1 OmpA family protein [Alphaproteobacteria bacterium]
MSRVAAALQRQGIPDNLVLSTRRASAVVTFLISQGVNPNIISAKGFGDTRPEALTTRRHPSNLGSASRSCPQTENPAFGDKRQGEGSKAIPSREPGARAR